MGHIKDIKTNLDPQTFPGAHFEIEGEPPQTQCSEAKIEDDDAWTQSTTEELHARKPKFAGYDLAGKVCTITASVGGNTGDFNILVNSDTTLVLSTDPGDGDPVEYYIHDGGELILTRDVQSFAEFIHAAGYAYTIKGGKLYTDMPSVQLKNACTILFDPLT